MSSDFASGAAGFRLSHLVQGLRVDTSWSAGDVEVSSYRGKWLDLGGSGRLKDDRNGYFDGDS